MPKVCQLPLDIHPNLLLAFSQLYPTVESYFASQEVRSVPEDTVIRDYTRQAEQAILDYAQQNLTPAPISGVALQADVQHKSRILTTGCDSVDELLLGGLREGQMTELVGEASTGKTQLCLQIAAITAARDEGVLYIDTCASFSASRVSAICQAMAARNAEAAQAHVQALRQIQVQRCHDLHQLLFILHRLGLQIAEQMQAQAGNEHRRVRLLIIDSVSSLISPSLGAKHSNQGHALMVQLAARLKQLAATQNVAVLLTNHLVSGSVGESRPALGESWRNQPHTRVLLTRQDSTSQPHRASLLASSMTALGPSASFQLGPGGVVNA